MRRLVGPVIMPVIVVAAALLLGACSDDGGSSGTAETTDTGDKDAFCAAVEAYLDAGDFTDEATHTAYEGFLEVAPKQIRGAVRRIVAAQAGEDIPGEELTQANDKFTAYVEHPDGCAVVVSSG